MLGLDSTRSRGIGNVLNANKKLKTGCASRSAYLVRERRAKRRRADRAETVRPFARVAALMLVAVKQGGILIQM